MGWKPSKHELDSVRNSLTRQLVSAVAAGRDIKSIQDALDAFDSGLDAPMADTRSAVTQSVGQPVSVFEALRLVLKIGMYVVGIGLMLLFIVWLL